MAGAFVDGALKGFEMMERHQARKDNKARLADLDKRNDQRYQDSLERQAQLDEERKNKAFEEKQTIAKLIGKTLLCDSDHKM